jgi:hypothetical protein
MYHNACGDSSCAGISTVTDGCYQQQLVQPVAVALHFMWHRPKDSMRKWCAVQQSATHAGPIYSAYVCSVVGAAAVPAGVLARQQRQLPWHAVSAVAAARWSLCNSVSSDHMLARPLSVTQRSCMQMAN